MVFDQVTHSRDTYQDLVRLMEQHRAERATQLSILRCRPAVLFVVTVTTMMMVTMQLCLPPCLCRILNKFLDNFEEDELPWHESIEPCLSSMTAFISDREVGSQLDRHRQASHHALYLPLRCCSSSSASSIAWLL